MGGPGGGGGPPPTDQNLGLVMALWSSLSQRGGQLSVKSLTCGASCVYKCRKGFQPRPLTPTTGSAPGSRWGLCLQTPVYILALCTPHCPPLLTLGRAWCRCQCAVNVGASFTCIVVSRQRHRGIKSWGRKLQFSERQLEISVSKVSILKYQRVSLWIHILHV